MALAGPLRQEYRSGVQGEIRNPSGDSCQQRLASGVVGRNTPAISGIVDRADCTGMVCLHVSERDLPSSPGKRIERDPSPLDGHDLIEGPVDEQEGDRRVDGDAEGISFAEGRVIEAS